MIKKLLILILAFVATPAAAQGVWSSGAGRTPVWDTSGILGVGGASTCGSGEAYNATQGGCPPATASEPTAINESTNYTASQWTTVGPAGTCIETDMADPHYGQDTGCRPWHGEDKIRLTCGFSHFGKFDPLAYPGKLTAAGLHHHTFFGNESIDQNSTYTTIRNAPRSTCAGGPLASSGYWIPSMIYEIRPGVKLPIKPEGVDVYYSNDARISPYLVRLLRGLTVIGGVNPSDYANSARQLELTTQLPAGAGTSWTQNLAGGAEINNDGFMGYKCVNRTTGITVALATNDNSTHTTRSWLNADGSNPWGAGNCEGTNYQIWSYVTAPSCWDGTNLTAPNGRDHWRYSVAYGGVEYCPRGWWRTPSLTAIHFYPAFTHAMRRKMYLSSDRMDAKPVNWKQPGTTMHFDWMMGWDDNTLKLAEKECLGITINGVTRAGGTGTIAQGRTCATSIIADNTALKTGPSPDTTWSRTPIVDVIPSATSTTSKTLFGNALPASAAVSGMSMH